MARRFALIVALAACKGEATKSPVVVGAEAGVGSATSADDLSANERIELGALKLGPLPADPTNRYADDPAAAALGQMLFFDEALGGPLLVDSALGKAGETGKVSCRTCHGGPALDDAGKYVSTGSKVGPRNAPPILNSAYYRWTNWGGRFDSHWALVLGASENPEVMNGNRLATVKAVAAKYRAEYEAIFGPLDHATLAKLPAAGKPKDPAWDALKPAERELVDRAFANVGKAIAAYMRLLVARDSPFDRFAAGDRAAISPSARRGFQLYLAHCKNCHSGPHFTDDKFHAIGIAQFGEGVPAEDLGRFTDVVPLLASPFNARGPHSDSRPEGEQRLGGLSQDPSQRGGFRTPTLRNVAVTAPYMHAGQLPSLARVVAFYNNGGGRVDGVEKTPLMKPLALTDEQQADLVAFMESLTDTRVPAALLVDTSR